MQQDGDRDWIFIFMYDTSGRKQSISELPVLSRQPEEIATSFGLRCTHLLDHPMFSLLDVQDLGCVTKTTIPKPSLRCQLEALVGLAIAVILFFSASRLRLLRLIRPLSNECALAASDP